MPDKSTNGAVVIPKWFLGIASLVLFGTVPWAWSQSLDSASTKGDVKTMATTFEVEMKSIAQTLKIITDEQTRRIDRNENRIDKMHELHRSGALE